MEQIKLKISLIQMDVAYKDPDANLNRAETMINKALKQRKKPNVLVLPEIKNGNEAKLEFQTQNNGEEARSATLIVVLYDKNTNKMENYSFAAKSFESGETTNLGAGFLVPDTGRYIIKCFVWESFENQDVILANPLEIEVKQQLKL